MSVEKQQRLTEETLFSAQLESPVKIEELDELHNINLVTNLPSIMRLGILSRHLVSHVEHESIAMEEIQDRRAKTVVPNGQRLHDYANLYINARNTMMYKRKDRHAEL